LKRDVANPAAFTEARRGEHMRTQLDVCDSDHLKVLQQIFDSVWFQMKQNAAFGFADEERLREQVSRRVIERANGDILDVEGIKQSVMASFES
jgi:hypothetical protein